MIKILARSIREYKKPAVLTPIFVSLEVIMECIIPFLIATLVNEMKDGCELGVIIRYGVVLVMMAILSLLFGAMAGSTCAVASCGLAKNLRQDIFHSIQTFSFENIDKFLVSSLVTRLTTDVTNVQNAYMMIIRSAIRAPLMVIFAFAMAIIMGGKLAWIFLIVMPVLLAGLLVIVFKAMPLFKKVFKKYDNLNASVQENIKAMRVVKSFVREDYEQGKFEVAAEDVCKDFTKAERILVLNNPLMQFCLYVVMIFILPFGAYTIITTQGLNLDVGQLSSLLSYGFMMLSSLMMLSMVFVMITMAVESGKRITEILTERSTLTNPENPKYEVADGSISFEHVSFKYSLKAERMALADITLRIKSGETIGIIGGTGSSKSSLIQLISRLYDATEGTVKVGGIDVKEYDLNTLRDQVAVVLQKNLLFSGTIKENLRWGDEKATDEELIHACKLACADEFITQFPDGYDTYIEQGGTNVSGGQKQRLCIARALLKKPKILILDDSTSAVDTKTDAKIRKAMREYIPETTKIIIAQRTASVEDADRIIVMDGGRIHAIGTHEELLEGNGIYREIYTSQNKAGIMMENKLIRKGVIGRLLKTIREFYPVIMPVTIVCIIFSAIVSAVPTIFMQKIIAVIEDNWESGDWNAISKEITMLVVVLAGFYVLSLLAGIIYNQLMAIITQGSLKKLRSRMFNGMQLLPIKYFDTNNHGDIMSHYTNDIDTLRQLISQSLPQLLVSGVTVVAIFCIMVYYCLWLTLVVLLGVALMLMITKKVGGGSARYFFRQQTALGKVEGFAEEMMNGQKVVKVFCHEDKSEAGFKGLNEELFDESVKANKYANTLIPILNNIGNVLYVIVAVVGGVLMLAKVPNVSLSGLAINISIVVPFLNMTKQFVGAINQVSNQVNAVVMGMAGAERIFNLMDQQPEQDDGYVTLVNVREENGKLTECAERTGIWAWKHPHQADGTVTYTQLTGDVRLFDVDFAYEEGKPVLHDISLYAKPGQKVAFVGATGAGKTTITNLLNRFYDIADGKIRYDGININKIRKSDLRHALGIVLQDTNLFTGTVMENIRYGKLDATDEECMAAAKLAGAHDFITRLPEGYQTILSGNGANLSQGQRQLLSIARAAVADPPVMILDEATSSIDTRTEAIVQRGMDALMEGRTVFVIAHRLSTVKNSNVIIVLDHGRIIERGDHDGLIAQKGQYYQLYTGAFELE